MALYFSKHSLQWLAPINMTSSIIFKRFEKALEVARCNEFYSQCKAPHYIDFDLLVSTTLQPTDEVDFVYYKISATLVIQKRGMHTGWYSCFVVTDSKGALKSLNRNFPEELQVIGKAAVFEIFNSMSSNEIPVDMKRIKDMSCTRPFDIKTDL